MRKVRRVSVLLVVLAVTPLCFAGELEGDLQASEVVAPQALMKAAGSFSLLGYAELPEVSEMEPQELAAVAEFFEELKPDWLKTVSASSSIAPQSSSSGCYYACFDLEDSGLFCPPGQRYALEATGPTYSCYIVGGGVCLSSGCTVDISSCRGFAANCSGGF